ncbi:MAG: retroviral-like aspartic protease family protein [Candidatus Binatia bacterium]
MRLVHVPMLLKGRRGRTRTVEMLVDSGAVWSLLPTADWRALGLKPQRKYRFALADGTVIERSVSDCRFNYEGDEAPSPVILGEDEDVALLGAVTLESLALVLNPMKRTLHPMRLMLMRMRCGDDAASAGSPL